MRILADIYSDSLHVHEIGMGNASDSEIWSYAAEHGFAIVSKDADFHQRSFLSEHPPKVIWIRRGNCSTTEAADILRRDFIAVQHFEKDAETAFLALA